MNDLSHQIWSHGTTELTHEKLHYYTPREAYNASQKWTFESIFSFIVIPTGSRGKFQKVAGIPDPREWKKCGKMSITNSGQGVSHVFESRCAPAFSGTFSDKNWVCPPKKLGVPT